MQVRLLIYLGSLILFLEGINAQSLPSMKGELNTLVPLPEHSKALFITFAYLEKYHYRKIKLNDSLSAIVFTNYFDGLDPSKVFFLKSDFDYFEKYKFKKIVTQCPHCFTTLKNDYSELGADLDVVHHSQFIGQLVSEGKINHKSWMEEDVPYHDACYLGRCLLYTTDAADE